MSLDWQSLQISLLPERLIKMLIAKDIIFFGSSEKTQACTVDSANQRSPSDVIKSTIFLRKWISPLKHFKKGKNKRKTMKIKKKINHTQGCPIWFSVTGHSLLCLYLILFPSKWNCCIVRNEDCHWQNDPLWMERVNSMHK